MMTTCVTVVRPPKKDMPVLRRAVSIFVCATRTTFSWLCQKDRPEAEVKRGVCAKFELVVRHWSGCRATAKAAEKAWRNGGLERLRMLGMRLQRLEGLWPKDSLTPDKKRRNAVARRKTETSIASLSKQLEGRPRWCFGGRDLLRRGRLREWRRQRDSEALFCGEDGRSAGNEVAQWRFDEDGHTDPTGYNIPTWVLQLRLPNSCSSNRLVLRDVVFPPKQHLRLHAAVEARRPVTWRVKLLARGKVQLCATFDEPDRGVVSDPAAGAVAVDLNRDHLAVARVSPDGRIAGAERVALKAGSHAVWQAAKAVVAQAAKAACVIVLENLDLRADKAWLRSYGKRFAEILSIFRYRQVRDAVERAARRAGIEVRYVDPAWTSELGYLKYRRRCRLGKHHAAALVIGRRGLGFGERLSEICLTLEHTVLECDSTSGESRVLVQRLPAAWLQGGRRRHGRTGPGA